MSRSFSAVASASGSARNAEQRIGIRLHARQRLGRWALLLALATPYRAAAHAPDAIGGGYASSGMVGEYHANPHLEGAPVFVRRDVRLAFDWGRVHPVGGSPAEPYRSFPTDGFSVRWTGRLVPRFSEPYRFVGEADDGIRIKLRKSGTSEWITLVDRWSAPGEFTSEPIDLDSGSLYDLVIEYVERAGEARCLIAWESPSTPREIIDPVRQQGLNATSFGDFVWADLMKTARWNAKGDAVDEHGWPTQSGLELVMSERKPDDPELSGTYLLRFKGKATVRQRCCTWKPSFRAGGVDYGDTLPAGAGYDPTTGITTALFTTPGSRSMWLFEEMSRPDKGGKAGLTDIHLFRPLEPGSEQHHGPTEVINRQFREMAQQAFTSIRWLEGANREGESDWSDRALPEDAFFRNEQRVENWEYLVILSNETGNDLYITTPIAANDEYFRKLALLLRYGSDGREPYSEPTANPLFPPLNPNLRAYVEVGNEIWNWAFPSTQVAKRLTAAEAEKGSAIWKAIDYDGEAGNPQHIRAVRRWHALRTVACSDAFRESWGDGAMGSRVRVLMEYQYDNRQRTATESFVFLDDYFTKPNEMNRGKPHPVTHYLWGGGAASYYGLENNTGSQEHSNFSDGSFETPPIAPGEAKLRPTGSPWKFRGAAGIYRPSGDQAIDSIERPLAPRTGSQAAFLREGGVISQRVRFREPGMYAVTFHAAGHGTQWPRHLPFDVYADDVKLNPRDQTEIREASGPMILSGWARPMDEFGVEWGSLVFRVDQPGERNIRFVGGKGSNYLLLEDIQISSVDALFGSGLEGGEAIGEVTGTNLEQEFRSRAKYVRAFGLQWVAYESGWSAGGDFEQLPIQNWAKLKDERAKQLNDRVIELWDEAAGFMMIWGVFKFWPDEDLAGAIDYPLMRSLMSSSNQLPTEAKAGASLPASLQPDDADWKHAAEAASGWRRYLPWCEASEHRSWASWMLIAPDTNDYWIHVQANGEGVLWVEVDGDTILRIENPSTGALEPIARRFTKGAHAIRAVTVGDVDVQRIDIDRQE